MMIVMAVLAGTTGSSLSVGATVIRPIRIERQASRAAISNAEGCGCAITVENGTLRRDPNTGALEVNGTGGKTATVTITY